MTVLNMDEIEAVYCPDNGEKPKRKVDEHESIERLISAFKSDYMYRKWARSAIFAIFFLAVFNFLLCVALFQAWSKNTELLLSMQKDIAVIQYETQVFKNANRGAVCTFRN